MVILTYITLGFLVLRWFTGLANVLTAAFIPENSVQAFPLISILIPVRNEAHNLPGLISQLLKLNYPSLEIIFLDDQSEDETSNLLKKYSLENSYLRFINGKDLPEGWLGKNWACQQLSLEAKGDYFLFMDADLDFLHEKLLERTLAQHQRLGLSLLSVFPDQSMDSWGEKIIVPLMHYVLLSMLPLWWIYRLPFPSMAAANGQFMMFHAADYRKFRWHERVKGIIAEDIAIMQELKRQGLKGMAFVGSGLVKARMYGGFEDGLRGFSKNMLSGFANKIAILWIFLLFLVPAWLVIFWVKLPFWVLFSSFALLLSLRGMISYLANQNILYNSLLHPLQIIVMLWIGVLSTWKKIRGKNEWKGRNVQL